MHVIKNLFKWLLNSGVIVIIVALSTYFAFLSDLSLKIQTNYMKIYLVKGKVVLVVPNVYDQYKVYADTLSYDYLFGIRDSFLNFDGNSYIVGRPLPDLIQTKQGNYYFTKDIERIQIARNRSDLPFSDNVLIFSDYLDQYSLQDKISSLVTNTLTDDVECNQISLNQCQGRLDSAIMNLSFTNDNSLDVHFKFTINQAIKLGRVKPVAFLNIPHDFVFCDETCHPSETVENPIKTLNDFPIETYEDKVLVKKETLNNLGLDKINITKLELPDIKKTLQTTVINDINPKKLTLQAQAGNKKIIIEIKLKSPIESVTVDYRFGKLEIIGQACQTNTCQIDLSYTITHSG